MASTRAIGYVLLAVSAVLILVYVYGIIIAPNTIVYGEKLSTILVTYTVFAIIVVIAGILGYLGYLIISTPIPKPVEEFIREYSEELRKLKTK